MMHSSKVIFGCGPLLLLAISLVLDWAALRTFNEQAETMGLQRIRTNFFMSAGALTKIRKSIPPGTIRTKITALQIASAGFALGFAALMILSINHK
jgi:hypothetical protein